MIFPRQRLRDCPAFVWVLLLDLSTVEASQWEAYRAKNPRALMGTGKEGAPENARQRLSVQSRLFAHWVLSVVQGKESHEMGVYRAENGKLHGCAEAALALPFLDFSVSHSHNVLALALSGHCAVGIDVESTARVLKTQSLARRCFSAADQSLIVQVEEEFEKKAMFLRLWTLREACVKSLASALRAWPLHQWAYDLNNLEGVRLLCQPPNLSAAGEILGLSSLRQSIRAGGQDWIVGIALAQRAGTAGAGLVKPGEGSTPWQEPQVRMDVISAGQLFMPSDQTAVH